MDPREARWIVESILGAVAVGILFAAVDIAYSFWFEGFIMPSLRPGKGPYLSYGQQAGLMWFLTVLLGAAVGSAVGIARRFNLLLAAVPPAVGALTLAGFVWQFRYARFEGKGWDASDWVVVVPPLFAAGVALGIALLLALTGWLRLAKSGN
jgi:hypothetical protein